MGLHTLLLNPDFDLTGGELVTVIGFPRTPPVPWAKSTGCKRSRASKYEGEKGAPKFLGLTFHFRPARSRRG